MASLQFYIIDKGNSCLDPKELCFWHRLSVSLKTNVVNL